ncbi:hypothetical protein HYC85_015816 [Camellia sinensis]|uniref:Bet v I/Major latex protein domain-containing protein n=1 Tax=Camellia sinensis TaxID=4442 RepID=A0A7J7H1N9_CAMSI|nr:hypothetical protein HYC85_015816 [Camellia sinensis]
MAHSLSRPLGAPPQSATTVRHDPVNCPDIDPDGKKKVIKDVIEAIDEENKSVTFKVIGGDVTELYRTFKITVHVDTKGENNLVTWTFEYEKKSEDVEDPNTLMDFAINVSKDIESHHLKS